MSLGLGDAVRLSWSNIANHKRRSLNVILTVAILFSVVMAANFVLAGGEHEVAMQAVQKTGEQVYLKTAFVPTKVENNFGKFQILDEVPEKAEEIINRRLEKYHGEKLGTSRVYALDQNYEIVSLDVVKEFIGKDLDEVPDGMVPVVVSGGYVLDDEEKGELYIVGEYPSTRPKYTTSNGFNVLSSVLYMISSGPRKALIIDDGSGKAESLIERKIETWRARKAEIGVTDPDLPVTEYTVARFGKMNDASRYVRFYEDALAFGYDPNTHLYRMEDMFSNPVAVMSAFSTYGLIVMVLELLLLIVALVISVLTLTHTVDDDVQIIALYRSMGASTLDILLIYLLYLVELCLSAILMCIVIALGLALVASLMSAGAMSGSLRQFYSLAEKPSVMLIGVNRNFWLVMLAILIVAPVTLILSLGYFSSKRIAAKLKEM